MACVLRIRKYKQEMERHRFHNHPYTQFFILFFKLQIFESNKNWVQDLYRWAWNNNIFSNSKNMILIKKNILIQKPKLNLERDTDDVNQYR